MNKAVFLDRDGVINVEKNYVHKIEDFEFVDGIFELLAYYQRRGYLLIVITNQAGIGRGFYNENDFALLTSWMQDQFSSRGITINDVFYCPYHPIHGIGAYRLESLDRKPNPGMIYKAQKKYNIDLKKSILIGDKESDIEAGLRAGVGRNILLSKDSMEFNSSSIKRVSSLLDLVDDMET